MISGLGFSGFGVGTRVHALTRQGIQDTIERLATGQRINRASDDPSDLQAITQYDSHIATLEADIERYTQDNNYLAARDGGLAALTDLVMGLEGAIVTGANKDAMSDEEANALQTEIDGTLDGILHVLQTSTFKGQALFTETLRSLGSVQGVPDDDATGEGEEADTTWTLAHLRSGGALSIKEGDLEKAQELVGSVVDALARQRGAIGSRMQSNDALKSQKLGELESITGARSNIADTDYAAETAELIRLQVLEQAQLATMQIGRQSAQSVLKLIDSAAPARVAVPARTIG